MADTTYTDGATLLMADTMNDLNRLHYTILGDPATASAVASPLSTKTTVASATTPDIFATTVGQVVDYTGTATCTGFVAAPQAGATRRLVCAGAAVFTAGANMLIDGVASGSNLTCAANDIVTAIAVTTTQFRLIVQKYVGFAALGANADITSMSGFTGLLNISNSGAGQIKFPSTQNASSDATTLDDYHEGTWTPSQGAGLTVVGAFSSSGRYTKIGRLVTVSGQVAGATSVAVAAGSYLCGNLPFADGSSSFSMGAMYNTAGTARGFTYIITSSIWAYDAVSAASAINFSITYTV